MKHEKDTKTGSEASRNRPNINIVIDSLPRCTKMREQVGGLRACPSRIEGLGRLQSSRGGSIRGCTPSPSQGPAVGDSHRGAWRKHAMVGRGRSRPTREIAPSYLTGMMSPFIEVAALNTRGPRPTILTIGTTLTTPRATPPGTDRPADGIQTAHALGPTAHVPGGGDTVRRN